MTAVVDEFCWEPQIEVLQTRSDILIALCNSAGIFIYSKCCATCFLHSPARNYSMIKELVANLYTMMEGRESLTFHPYYSDPSVSQKATTDRKTQRVLKLRTIIYCPFLILKSLVWGN